VTATARGMARTAPVTAAAGGLARTAPTAATARGLQKIRATYGAALVFMPGPVIWLATGRRPSPRACRVARLLGTRHLIQAALTAAAPEPAVLAIGGQVDAVHAASMLLLAAVSRTGRRAALADALTEAAFAAAGFSAGVLASPGGPVAAAAATPLRSAINDRPDGFWRGFPGQSTGVSLPVSEQRALDGIESALEGGEARLRSMFAIFTRLTHDEGEPRTEALRAETLLRRVRRAGGLTGRVRVIVAVALMLGLVTLFVVMAMAGSAAHGCRPGPLMVRPASCQQAQQAQARS
jgi:hypothetical protein